MFDSELTKFCHCYSRGWLVGGGGRMVKGGSPWKRKECGEIKNRWRRKPTERKKTKHVRTDPNLIDCFKSLFKLYLSLLFCYQLYLYLWAFWIVCGYPHLQRKNKGRSPEFFAVALLGGGGVVTRASFIVKSSLSKTLQIIVS